jgi:hypothetical protein
MTQPISTPSSLTAPELQRLLVPGAAHLPELQPAQSALDALRVAPQTQIALAETAPFLEGIADIPAQLPAAAELEFRLRFEFIPATTLPPNSSTSRSDI